MKKEICIIKYEKDYGANAFTIWGAKLFMFVIVVLFLLLFFLFFFFCFILFIFSLISNSAVKEATHI